VRTLRLRNAFLEVWLPTTEVDLLQALYLIARGAASHFLDVTYPTSYTIMHLYAAYRWAMNNFLVRSFRGTVELCSRFRIVEALRDFLTLAGGEL
jgi:hypothetical protein